MESNSSKWLRIVCEGDEKSIRAFSEIFSYYVGTLPVEDSLFEKAKGVITEDSTEERYLLELYGVEIVESFFKRTSLGMRKHEIGFDEEGNLISILPHQTIFRIFSEKNGVSDRRLKLTCTGDRESLNLIKTYFRNAVRDLDFKRDENTEAQYLLELEGEEVVTAFLFNLLRCFELPLKKGGQRDERKSD